MKPLWMFFHNCIVHPLMGVFELLTWDYFMPKQLEQLHEWSGRQAGFE
jgi:hypothetical protein